MRADLHRYCVVFIVALSSFGFCSRSRAAATNAPDIDDAIVKIYAVSSHADYLNPWNAGDTASYTGSGCIMKGRKLITNAHVVSDSTFLQVRRYGQPQRYNARVENVSHEADLAILTVDDPDFFEGASSLDFGDLPAPQQEVMVYGFPMGGDTMSITKGVVSRVEHQTYIHSGLPLLAVQIDAAINPGNSGGPAIVGGRIAGVAMMTIEKANNIGYIVPVTIIRHFLDAITSKRPPGFPSLGLLLQPMENPDLKRKFKTTVKQDGMLVTRILRNSPAHGALEAGDVITRLDDQPVASDGTVEFRKGERTSLALVAQQHHLGEKLKVDFLRNGKSLSAELTLNNRMTDDLLVPLERYDVVPTYYIWGGLVFCPLTTDLLKSWGQNWQNDAPKDLMALLDDNVADDQVEEVVLLLRVLADDLNQGYQDMENLVIRKVNGNGVRSLKQLIPAIENARTQYIAFEGRNGEQIVLDREHVAKNQAGILRTYGIARDRSTDLLPPVPKTSKTP